MYGTVVDVGVVAEACKEVAPDPVAFNTQWRAKQLEYTFLRSLMGRYRDFGKVTEEALEFAIQRFALQVTAEQRQRLMETWLRPTPYLEVATALSRLKEKYLLAVLSNGTPRMLRTGLERTGLRPHFYKPLSKVYQLAPNHKRLPKSESRFVSSSSFNVMGAINFGFRVCRINRTSAPLDPLGPKPDLVVKSLDDLVGAL